MVRFRVSSPQMLLFIRSGWDAALIGFPSFGCCLFGDARSHDIKVDKPPDFSIKTSLQSLADTSLLFN